MSDKTTFGALKAERDKLLAALEKIAAYDDKYASAALRDTGSYALFDEPVSVKIAREALPR